MSTSQQELLRSQTNVKQADKQDYSNNEPEIEYEPVNGTPFTTVRREDKYYLMMGKYRLNEIEYTTPEEVVEYMIREQYNIITKMIAIMVNDLNNK